MQNCYYFDAITTSGAIPMPLPILPSAQLRHLYELCDGLLLPGGKDVDPENYGVAADSDATIESQPELDLVELELVCWARDDRIPLVGICRGAQLLNVALGGTLWLDLDRDRGNGQPHGEETTIFHDIAIEPDSALAAMVGTTRLTVNSRHHQAVRTTGTGLRTVAHSQDGVIEAVEAGSHWFALGVQWHPEELPADHPAGPGLIGALVNATGHTVSLP